MIFPLPSSPHWAPNTLSEVILREEVAGGFLGEEPSITEEQKQRTDCLVRWMPEQASTPVQCSSRAFEAATTGSVDLDDSSGPQTQRGL